MTLDRRTFVRGLTGAGLVAVGGALGGCDSMPESATRPWRGPSADLSDARSRMISWAILAPNPHNRQPWLVDLRKEGEIALYCDRERLLPETDPYSRQILIGHGAFLGLLEIAASADGYALDIDILPEGPFDDRALDGRPVARIALRRDSERKRDPLFDAIPIRRSTKTPYDPRPVGAADLAALATAVGASPARFGSSSEASRVEALRAIADEAYRVEYVTPRTLKESIDLMRIGADEIARHPDGLRMHGMDVWWGRALGIIDKQKIMTPGTMAYDIGLNGYAKVFAATPSWGWLVTDDNTRGTQIETGRAYARLDLAAATAGVAIHPASQALQEYPEVAGLYDRLHATLSVAQPARIQMLVRLGHAEKPVPTARRPIASFMLV